MTQPPSIRVSLTGDRSGTYLVIDERPDGSLVIAPDSESPGDTGRSRPGHRSSSFAKLLSRPRRSPPNVHRALDAWGVSLVEDEFVTEFLAADLDGRTGFAAVTSRRFIFLAQGPKGLEVAFERPLSALRAAEFRRRGLKQTLQVSWEDSEAAIGAPDRDTLARLQARLRGR
jgi:hypothetical protein